MSKRLLVLALALGVTAWFTLPVQAFGRRNKSCCATASSCGGCGTGCNTCATGCGTPCAMQVSYVNQVITCYEQRFIDKQVPYTYTEMQQISKPVTTNVTRSRRRRVMSRLSHHPGKWRDSRP